MYAADYKRLARQKLTGNWGNAILALLLFELLNAILSSTVIGSLLLTGTLAFGYTMFFKAIRDGYHPSLELIFRGFSVNFLSSMLANLLVALFTFLLESASGRSRYYKILFLQHGSVCSGRSSGNERDGSDCGKSADYGRKQMAAVLSGNQLYRVVSAQRARALHSPALGYSVAGNGESGILRIH